MHSAAQRDLPQQSPTTVTQSQSAPGPSKPTVSVLMPCYNAAETLDQAVASILDQSFGDLELVAVDDGSSDATAELLERWAGHDRRVRPIHTEHRGIIEALNTGLTACRGQLIARMDADDRSHPERLARQLRFLDRHPELGVAGCLVEGTPLESVAEGFQIYLDWLNGLVTSEEIARELYIESPLVHPSVLMRRECIERVAGYQEHGWPEDYDLWLRMHAAGIRFAKLPEVLFYWREHPERLTRTDSRYSVENFLRAKAHYLCRGPLAEREAVVLWGAGQMGRRLSKHLQRGGANLVAFVDIDPGKIGRRKRGVPIIAVEQLQALLDDYPSWMVLAAVGSRGARQLIRERLVGMGMREGKDFYAVA